jgi:hypothetical protein
VYIPSFVWCILCPFCLQCLVSVVFCQNFCDVLWRNKFMYKLHRRQFLLVGWKLKQLISGEVKWEQVIPSILKKPVYVMYFFILLLLFIFMCYFKCIGKDLGFFLFSYWVSLFYMTSIICHFCHFSVACADGNFNGLYGYDKWQLLVFIK